MLLRKIILSTLLIQTSLAKGPAINVQDRIETQKIFLNSYETLFGQKEYARSDDFIETIQELPKKKEKRR